MIHRDHMTTIVICQTLKVTKSSAKVRKTCIHEIDYIYVVMCVVKDPICYLGDTVLQISHCLLP